MRDLCLTPSPDWVHAEVGRARAQMSRARAVDAFRAGVPSPVSLLGVNHSRVALVVTCAANLAQAIAHERRLSGVLWPTASRQSIQPGTSRGATSAASAATDAPSATTAEGVAAEDEPWLVYVSSDSAGLRALLERIPGLRGHVVGCSRGHTPTTPTTASSYHPVTPSPRHPVSLPSPLPSGRLLPEGMYRRGASDGLVASPIE